ncbi:MAG: alpha/beta fold hydrolase [Steroidobacteraceae bacterium]
MLPPMSTRLRVSITALLLCAWLQPLAAVPPIPAAAPLALQDCRLEQPQKLLALHAECGELTVPENPAEPEGRQISLFIARIPAVNRRAQPDPLFILAGGPGLAASAFYPGVAGAFGRVHRDRDIVLVDQRGTGRSQPLQCDVDEDGPAADNQADEEWLHVMRECLAQLSRNSNLAYYTTSIAVRDLDAVRAALGYPGINLYGGSYGSRVAQHYLRRYPQHSRSVVLDGVVPPELALGPGIALDAQAALLKIFARCRADAACQGRFGDPEKDYRDLSTRLASKPVLITVPDPRTGALRALTLGSAQLAAVLRLQSYSADQAAMLPLTLSLANRDNNLQPLAAQFLLTTHSVSEAIAYGMHNSVVCAEDVPFYADVDRAQLAQTYLGTSQVDALVGLCKFWPRGPMDEDLHAPLHSAVPALLLSGGADPVTPSEYGERARRGFTQALHITLPDQGHGQLLSPCMDRVMADFIEAASLSQLDTACTKQARPSAFLLSLTGSAP